MRIYLEVTDIHKPSGEFALMKGHSIKHHLLLSWILPMVLAIGGSAVLSLSISYLDFSNRRQSIETKLHDDARTVARRVAAELLLKEDGRLDAVKSELVNEFRLASLEVTSNSTRPFDRPGVMVSEKVPDVAPPAYVHLQVSAPGFLKFVSLRRVLLALIPILALVLSGFFIQSYLLNRYLIRPIRALAKTSAGTQSVRDHWPVEIQKIASELAESFSNREQAIFGQLARGLIHDIRTQINPINTALQLVKETAPDSVERRARLDKLANACERNIPKIRELLDLSLDSSREIVLRTKSSDVRVTLHQSILNVQEMADAKGVLIRTNPYPPIEVQHDRLQLERVFTNLIKNAVEAVEGQPNSHRHVEVTTVTGPTGLTVRIEDSGQGLNDPKQLFRPFRTTKTHGYGLGLFVSKKIVEAHRGHLEASRSDRLGGASFTVSIPGKEITA